MIQQACPLFCKVKKKKKRLSIPCPNKATRGGNKSYGINERFMVKSFHDAFFLADNDKEIKWYI